MVQLSDPNLFRMWILYSYTLQQNPAAGDHMRYFSVCVCVYESCLIIIILIISYCYYCIILIFKLTREHFY